MELITYKAALVEACRALLDVKIQQYDSQVKELAAGAQNEAKSSAGDKHETARAMAQLEQEKLMRQLSETQQLQRDFERIDFQSSSEKIVRGSLVLTNQGKLLIAVALGKVKADESDAMVISIQSPLAMHLLGKRKGESFSFNQVNYNILDCC